MREACSLIWSALVLLFRSRASLAAEILVLRHQINILRRHSPARQTFSARDRLIFAELYQFPARGLVSLTPSDLGKGLSLAAAALLVRLAGRREAAGRALHARRHSARLRKASAA
jgi:hypothetical protein